MKNSKKPSDLPLGWEKIVTERKSGKTKGSKDVYVVDPSGRRFRSKKELKTHLENTGISLKIEDFDFSKTTQVINKAGEDTKSQKKKKSKRSVNEPVARPDEKKNKLSRVTQGKNLATGTPTLNNDAVNGTRELRKSGRKTRVSSRLNTGLFYSNNNVYSKVSCKLVIKRDWQKEIDGETRVVAKTGAPPGWSKVLHKRKHGVYKGRFDVYMISPQGFQFRSRPELQAFIDKNSLNLSIKDFDMTSPLPVSMTRKRLASQPLVGPPKKVLTKIKSWELRNLTKHSVEIGHKKKKEKKNVSNSYEKRKLNGRKMAKIEKSVKVSNKETAKTNVKSRAKRISKRMKKETKKELPRYKTVIRKNWQKKIDGETLCIDKESKVPAGWSKVLRKRKNGAQKTRSDVYIFSPQGAMFRSRPELRAFLEQSKSKLTINDFDMRSPYSRKSRKISEIDSTCDIQPHKPLYSGKHAGKKHLLPKKTRNRTKILTKGKKALEKTKKREKRKRKHFSTSDELEGIEQLSKKKRPSKEGDIDHQDCTGNQGDQDLDEGNLSDLTGQLTQHAY